MRFKNFKFLSFPFYIFFTCTSHILKYGMLFLTAMGGPYKGLKCIQLFFLTLNIVCVIFAFWF